MRGAMAEKLLVNYPGKGKEGKVRGGVGTFYLDKLKDFQILLVHVDLL
jgi:hypothetical protein